MRKAVIAESRVARGTVPIYEAIVRQPDVSKITEDDFLESVRTHNRGRSGLHNRPRGVTRSCIPLLEAWIMGVVSRGGSFLVKWMMHHGRKTRSTRACTRYWPWRKATTVTLSLGDGLRPGMPFRRDRPAQIEELKTLGALARRATRGGRLGE
jgi:phosphomethylpyrimidine synthase